MMSRWILLIALLGLCAPAAVGGEKGQAKGQKMGQGAGKEKQKSAGEMGGKAKHDDYDKAKHEDKAKQKDREEYKADKDKNRDRDKDRDHGWESRDGFEHRVFGDGDSRPPGWSKGKKTGWDNCGVPPGQAKKGECRTYRHEGRRYYYYRDDQGRTVVRRAIRDLARK